MKAANCLRALVLLIAFFCVPAACLAQGWRVGLAVDIVPPPLPVYEQPPIPAPDYLWTPGYWAYGEDGYYWVPGTWVLAPAPGLLWTPGYWRAAEDGLYVWNAGYWGPRIGFYGGINYGCGYFGIGFEGGYWRHGAFFYNRAVTNINNISITNVYNNTVVNRPFRNSRVSYNGGAGGVNLRASGADRLANYAPHYAATGVQRQHEAAAHAMPSLHASVNHGQPPVAATPRPRVFAGHGVTRAEGQGMTVPRSVSRMSADRAINPTTAASPDRREFSTPQSARGPAEPQTRNGSVTHLGARSPSPSHSLVENYSALAQPAYAHRYSPSPSAGALARTRGMTGPATSDPRHQSQAGAPYSARAATSYSPAARQPAAHLIAPARPAQAPTVRRELARAQSVPHSVGNLARTSPAAHAAQNASHGPKHG